MVAEVIATLAKEGIIIKSSVIHDIVLFNIIIESFRDIAKEWKVIASLLPLLSFHENTDMRVQAMRAVGNLCIDHGEMLIMLPICHNYSPRFGVGCQ